MALEMSDIPPEMVKDIIWMAQRMDLPVDHPVNEVRIADTRYTRLLRKLATRLMDIMERELDKDD